MTALLVDNIVEDLNDETGARIVAVYAKVSTVYAVYRTDERVMVQFADVSGQGAEQRLALAPLAPLRGHINGLIDGWRAGGQVERRKAKMFDRRVADALTVALQGQISLALELLKATKIDLLEERTAVGRSQYIMAAGVIGLGLIALFGLITTGWWNRAIFSFDGDMVDTWRAAGVGVLGALFSVALSIRDRSIRTDLQFRDNAVDAAMRVAIGAVSAALLLALLRAKLVTIGLGGAAPIADPLPDAAFVIAFVAGFSERLVGDLLQRSVLSATGGTNTNPLAGDSPTQTSTSGAANERNPLGTIAPAAPAPPPAASAMAPLPGADAADPVHDHTDDCIAGGGLADNELTSDSELPAARGGVAAI